MSTAEIQVVTEAYDAAMTREDIARATRSARKLRPTQQLEVVTALRAARNRIKETK
jgi:hypothetical protein